MNLSTILIELIFPDWCCACGTLGDLLCRKCFQKISFYPEHVNAALHCETIQATTAFQQVTRSLVHALKYQSVKNVAPLCARLMYLYGIIPKCDLVTAIPLHPIRFNERGFNQAEEIAQELAALLERPFLQVLKRKVYTTNLATITDREVRQKLIASQFDIIHLHRAKFNHKKVLLIDDVFTTGSTLEEAARILKLHGAYQVYGLTFTHES